MDLVIRSTVKENIKIIFGAIISGSGGLISTIEGLNAIVVFLSACTGLAVGILTIIKIYLDIKEKLKAK